MKTLGQVLQATIAHHRNRVAILDETQKLTWWEFGVQVSRAAGVLMSLGINKGERFGVLARNSYRVDELKWAGFSSGIIPVPVNWRLAPPEIQYILEDADCKIVFVEEEFLGNFNTAELGSWGGKVIRFPEDYEQRKKQAQIMDAIRIDPDDDAILLYTGGTTGRSKGVRLSHMNLVSNAVGFGLEIQARSDDVYLHAAPMFHSADLLANPWFLLGGAHCYLPNFSPDGFLRAIENYKATAVVTVPAMLIAIVSYPDFHAADVSSLRTLMYGAAPMALEWIRKVAAAFPHANFSNIYGLTETSPLLTVMDANEFRTAIESGDSDGIVRSIGKPNVLNDLKVVDLDGNEVTTNEVGELWARGPNIMKGYLNLPDKTSEVLVDGWFRTGDMGRIDEDGYVYLLDRLNDMIISGGENVYASEVEAALHTHPGVYEAAVIGVPDTRLGEALFAVVVPVPDTELTDEMLISHCRPLIGGYKIPRQYAFIDALPKSALGKILKTKLRELYRSDRS